MLSAAATAFADALSPPFRRVLLKAIAISLLLLVLLWLAIEGAVVWLVELERHPWLDAAVNIATGIGAFVLAAFLLAPVVSLVAGLYVDEIAALTEARHYPSDPPGRPLPFWEGLRDAAAFAGLTLLVNAVALLLLLVPGVNLVAFFLGNGYLLGREFFELAARRHLDRDAARRLRRSRQAQLLAAGLVIAALLAVPLLNLLTPIFAPAFMVHLHKRIARRAGAARDW
jgi:CysZ protein